jgi:putative transposase
MTQARRITPGMTVMVTRRTLRRTHLLRPDARLTNLFVYVLAVVAARHNIQVHAAVVMSTHEHIVLTDPHGCLPRFLQELHRLLALREGAAQPAPGWRPPGEPMPSSESA